jgi:hypothetical protein
LDIPKNKLDFIWAEVQLWVSESTAIKNSLYKKKKGIKMEKRILNVKQLAVLWIGITIIALMGIFPPVKKTVTRTQASTPSYCQVVAYDFLFTESLNEIEYQRLLIQWLITAIVTTGLAVTFEEKATRFTSKPENSKFYPSSLLAEKRY